MWVFGTLSMHTEECLYTEEATLCPCWNISVLHSRNVPAPSLVLALFHVKFACSHPDCVSFLLGNLTIFLLPTNMPAWTLFFPSAHMCEYVFVGESYVLPAMEDQFWAPLLPDLEEILAGKSRWKHISSAVMYITWKNLFGDHRSLDWRFWNQHS